MEKLKILLLEDLEDDAGLVENVLRKGEIDFVAMRVDTREEFTDAVRTFQPDVVLSDHALPQFNSSEALKICKRENHQGPFILVTGTVSEEFAVNCLKQGADDYILKSNLSRLPSALINALKNRQMEAKKKEAEKSLRTQNEKLVKANTELDNFVYSVSHNLRSPLTSVLGLLNLVKNEKKDLDQTLKKYCTMMEHSIHKLDGTLREILDYSRNNRIEVANDKIDVRKLVEQCFDGLQYLEAGEIRKKIDVIGDPFFYSDAHRLSIILNNIICNAIKYRDLNKAVAEINIYVEATPVSATIHCHDNGIGIGEEYQPRVFEMFYRATERSDGAGLGLYIVKETVEKLGGTVMINSKIGEGTTLVVTVPNLGPPPGTPEP
jgi:signal transduction histidine kinase